MYRYVGIRAVYLEGIEHYSNKPVTAVTKPVAVSTKRKKAKDVNSKVNCNGIFIVFR